MNDQKIETQKSNKLYNEQTQILKPNQFLTYPWTERENQRLFNSYLTQSKETLQMLFPDRTWRAIRDQASVLKITHTQTKWSEEEIQQIMELKEKGYSYTQMSEFLRNRSPKAIKHKYRRTKNGCKKME